MKQNKKKRKLKRTLQYTRQFVGAKTFDKDRLITYGKGTLAFFKITPVNISVLSHVNIESKIRRFMMVLSAMPNIEVCCLDSSECFDDNIIYLEKRIQEEENYEVRKLLQKDLNFLDQIQLETATARTFMFVIRFRTETKEQIATAMKRTRKLIMEQGFETVLATRDEIKRTLAIYFEQNIASEYDNERWAKADAILQEKTTSD